MDRMREIFSYGGDIEWSLYSTYCNKYGLAYKILVLPSSDGEDFLYGQIIMVYLI